MTCLNNITMIRLGCAENGLPNKAQIPQADCTPTRANSAFLLPFWPQVQAVYLLMQALQRANCILSAFKSRDLTLLVMLLFCRRETQIDIPLEGCCLSGLALKSSCIGHRIVCHRLPGLVKLERAATPPTGRLARTCTCLLSLPAGPEWGSPNILHSC